MRPTEFEDDLRELVAELASIHSEDIDAVLSLLDLESAEEVRSLLQAYARMENLFDLKPQENTVSIAGLSQWLSDRVQVRHSDGARRFEMTPHCAGVLRELACSLSMPAMGISVSAGSNVSDGKDRRQSSFGRKGGE